MLRLQALNVLDGKRLIASAQPLRLLPVARNASSSSNASLRIAACALQHLSQQIARAPLKPPGRQAVWCAAGKGDSSGGGGTQSTDAGGSSLLISGALLAVWAGLVAYAFVFSPNQTPTIDQFILLKLVGLKPDDPYQVNTIYTSVFNMMGIYPLVYASLLIPAARSNKLPAWPFVVGSMAMGAFALLPYMALWSPKTPPQQLPPPKEELEGWNRLFLKGAETPVLPALLAAGAGFYLFKAVTAGGDAWVDYLRLFDQSRLVHVTTVDFMLCTLLAPFWMSNDAEGRKWQQRDTLLPVLSALPLVGPAIYLVLRPKADTSSPSS